MLGSQSDPILVLSISQQRHADLIADVRHDRLVRAALRYAAARTLPPQEMTRGRLARIGALASAALHLAPMTPTPVQGG